ncbi:hypothetical protein NDN08_005671 [Rhodosorus marinus]|uniref:Uncharacterized protein n=1 Tax=Rhodosorus marinus TaxID=101924 RepID=A0AAV8V461_9RHOD|nr:hypothetical protein NDN08_005671 [Rhodosorus marinus]
MGPQHIWAAKHVVVVYRRTFCEEAAVIGRTQTEKPIYLALSSLFLESSNRRFKIMRLQHVRAAKHVVVVYRRAFCAETVNSGRSQAEKPIYCAFMTGLGTEATRLLPSKKSIAWVSRKQQDKPNGLR